MKLFDQIVQACRILRAYQDEVRRLVDQTNNAAYQEAIGVVQDIRRLMTKMGS